MARLADPLLEIAVNILVLHTSLNTDHSATRAMAAAYLADTVAAYPDAAVTEHDLARNPVPHLSPELVPVQFGAAPEQRTVAVELAETLITQLEAADLIIIGAPMYNFTVPSTLKAWLDHVIRAQRTFSYATGTPQGLLQPGKRVVAMVASGGVYSQGPAQAMDFVEPYLRTVLGFIGLIDVTVIRAEAQAVPDAGPRARADAIEHVHALAAA